MRAYDAKPSAAAFPWSLFSTQITPLTLSNVAGRLAAVASKSNGAWQITLFSYDVDGQVATRYTYTQANGGASVLTAINTTVTYARDLRDALTQRSLTVGTSTFYQWYDYDGRGLLSKLYASTMPTKPGTPDVTDTYRPSGQPQNYQFAAWMTVPLRYTIREQLEWIGDPSVTTYPFSARYTYHPNGTLLETEFQSAGSPAAAKRYKYWFGGTNYDALNRLKGADFTEWSGGTWTVTATHDLGPITYDAAGNILTLQRRNDVGTLIDNLTYTIASASNRLTAVSDAAGVTGETWDAETGAFTYDANGNVKTAAPAPYSITTPITYDYQNLPVSLTRSGVTTTYRYDDAGQRITKQVGTGNTEVYVREGATTLGVFTVNSSGAVVSSYFNLLWADRVVGCHTSTGTRTYYHFDHLGSTRAVVLSTTNAVVESYDYEPWGLLMPGRTLAGPTKEGFSGKEQDAETGLDYFGARYYLPALGRWAGVDPTADAMPEWSTYNYVYDNPVLHGDPDGRQPRFNIPTTGDWFDEGLIAGALAHVGAVLERLNHFIESIPLLGPAERTAGGIGADGTPLTTEEHAQAAVQTVLDAVTIVEAVRSVETPVPGLPKGEPTPRLAPDAAQPTTLKPGPHAGESIPVDGPGRATPAQQTEINRIGRETGCHTCGAREPGTASGNHVLDHQPPSRLNPPGNPQRGYPHCLRCSRRQGGEVNAERARRRPPPPPPPPRQDEHW